MLQQQIQRKQKSFALPRGLYVLRYETAADPTQPPLVTVVCEAGRNEVILHPDQSRPTMSVPGQALVIRAAETGNVQVEISSSGHSGTLDATLKFEPIKRDSGTPAGLQPYRMGAANEGGSAVPVPIQLLGHVSRLGDVMVGPDEWLGGPSSPARVEGFLVRWPGRPADVQLAYAATISGQRPGEARVVEVDEFAGTRGRARPITAVAMELSGAGARGYQLQVEALFLGAPVRKFTGQSIAATGPTGREPLVGLRLSMSSGSAQARPFYAPAAEPPLAPAQTFGQPSPFGSQPIAAAPPPQTFSAPLPTAGPPTVSPESPRVRVFRG
jgi:hypothetical protein